MTEYRFDTAYETVYRFDDNNNVYVRVCNFMSAKINKRDSEKTMIRKMKKWELR